MVSILYLVVALLAAVCTAAPHSADKRQIANRYVFAHFMVISGSIIRSNV